MPLVAANGRRVVLAAVAITLLAATGALGVPRAPVSWGVYVPDAPPANLASIHRLGTDVGKQPGIVMWYPNWGGPYSDVKYARAGIDAVLKTGSAPMLNWMSRDPSVSAAANAARYSNDAIAAGSQDTYIRTFARGLAGARGTVYLNLDHEMNGRWYPWSPGSGGSTAASFIAMWRHVHALFVREGARNVRWVWAPNVACGGCTRMADLYPGDAYVDWIGLDGYNFGTTAGHQWQSFDQVFKLSYNEILRVARKPLMIAEIGTVERGPSAGQTKAAWIRDALTAMARRYPAVHAFVWFERNDGNGQDFRIRSASADVAAFRTASTSTVYVTGPPR